MALHEILTNSMTAPREARQAMARFLSKAKLLQLTDDAQLLASELVTNAVRHSSGPIDVRAYVRDGFLRLEVGDSAVDRAPLPRTAAPDDEGGRGMELVEKLSARWGWRARGPVKVVWLDLPMRIWFPRLVRRTLRRIRGREQLWNGNSESLRGAVWGRESLFVWAFRSHFRRRRDWPNALARYPVVRLRTLADVEEFLARASASATEADLSGPSTGERLPSGVSTA